MIPIPSFVTPGLPELILISVLSVVAYAFVARLVYIDARSRGSEWAWQWAVATFFLLLFGFAPGVFLLLVYLLIRDERTGATPDWL